MNLPKGPGRPGGPGNPGLPIDPVGPSGPCCPSSPFCPLTPGCPPIMSAWMLLLLSTTAVGPGTPGGINEIWHETEY